MNRRMTNNESEPNESELMSHDGSLVSDVSRAARQGLPASHAFFILSCNYWFTNVYCYYTFLSIRHKSLCPRHELDWAQDVTKMVVINLGCWLWLIVFSDVPTMFW